MTVEEVHEIVTAALNDLQPLFIDKAELTFIMRLPNDGNADMVVTNDNLVKLRDVIDRSIQRERLKPSKS